MVNSSDKLIKLLNKFKTNESKLIMNILIEQEYYGNNNNKFVNNPTFDLELVILSIRDKTEITCQRLHKNIMLMNTYFAITILGILYFSIKESVQWYFNPIYIVILFSFIYDLICYRTISLRRKLISELNKLI